MSLEYYLTQTIGFSIPAEKLTHLEDADEYVFAALDYQDLLTGGRFGESDVEPKAGRDYYWIGIRRLTNRIDPKDPDDYLHTVESFELNEEEKHQLSNAADALGLPEPQIRVLFGLKIF